MKLLLHLFLIATLISCSNRQGGTLKEKVTNEKTVPTFPGLAIRDINFPLTLIDIDFQDTNNIEVCNDVIERKITNTIKAIYYNDCGGDSSQSYFSIDDTYIGTLRLRDSLRSVFMILFQHIPGGLDSKILFYDMGSKEFSNTTLDFNIHGLYELDGQKLKPTNLKKQFKIVTPEIELVDFDKDGINDYKFTRLYHNGTANAIETAVIKVSDNKIDTLDFQQKWIR